MRTFLYLPDTCPIRVHVPTLVRPVTNELPFLHELKWVDNFRPVEPDPVRPDKITGKPTGTS